MGVGHRHILVLLLVVLALETVGCNGVNSSGWTPGGNDRQSGNLQVEQRVGGQAASFKADEIVRIMRRIGIPDDQIYSLGPSLRDVMRTTGAAAISRAGQPQVMLAVNEDHLFVQTRGQGSFIYDMKDKRFIAVPPMPAR